MALEQSGLLSSLISKFRRKPSGSTRSTSGASAKSRRRLSAVEQLEDRRLMVSRVFVDFGHQFDIPTDGVYAGLRVLEDIPPAEMISTLQWDFGGPGGTGFSELFGFAPGPTGTFDLVSLFDTVTAFKPIDIDGDGFFGTPADALALERQIMSSLRRALEPFDIDVLEFESGPEWDDAMEDLADPDTGLLLENNLIPEGGIALPSATPQFGRDDVYIYVCGTYDDPMDILTEIISPISATFGVEALALGSAPNRNDGGGIVGANYWIDRVAGALGSGDSAQVAMANAAMYIVGNVYGLSEIENGKQGPYTHFSDEDVELINQSSAMVEAGFNEFGVDFFAADGIALPINTNHSAYFNRYDMMRNGNNYQLFLRQGVLGNPPQLIQPIFPLPPNVGPLPIELNEDPDVRANLYEQLLNDSDIGRNPAVEYVTGTGAFDRIKIRKLSGDRAQVTIEVFRDKNFTQRIETYSYTISLKTFITDNRNPSQTFRVIIEGCNSNDQVFVDAELGVQIVAHGGPNIERLKISGNGKYNAVYTPDRPAVNPITEHYIPEGFQREASGVLVITGDFGTTRIIVDNYNPNNSSAIRLEHFNRLTYMGPGHLGMHLDVEVPRPREWRISGDIANNIFPNPAGAPVFDALTGNLEFSRVKHLVLDTTLGRSDDQIHIRTNAAVAVGLLDVHITMGAGSDRLRFDDGDRLSDLDYFVTPTEVDYGTGPSTTFQGFSYNGVQQLTVNGTQGDNDVVVVPSKVTEYFIFGDEPQAGFLKGDSLAIRRSGTTGATLIPNGINNGKWTFTSGHRDVVFSSIEELVLPTAVVAVSGASDTGKGKPLVKVYDAQTNELSYSFYAYPQSFTGGVRVAVADMNGDNVPDIVVAPGFGRGAVKVYDGAELLLAANSDGFVSASKAEDARLKTIEPEGSDYRDQGLYVALGDVDGDGDNDIVTSRSRGETRVRVFANNGTGKSYSREASWRPYSTTVISGAVLAVADIDKDGLAEVITAPGTGVAASVRIFTGTTGGLITSFNAFESSFRNGVSIAAGDADGDGRAEIFVGAGTGGGSRVRMFSRTGTLKQEFKAYTSGNVNAPLRIAAVDPDGADRVLLFVGQGNDGESHRIRLFDPLSGHKIDEFLERDPAFEGGVFVG